MTDRLDAGIDARRKRVPLPRVGTLLRTVAWFALRLLLVVLFIVWWFVLRIVEHESWPPPDDAVTAAQAEAATAAFLARDDVAIPDLAIPLAPSTAAIAQFYSGGDQFFPAILDDLARAESSIHILMFAIGPGDVADSLVAVLEDRARAGVEVRLIVDRFASKVDGHTAPLFDRMQAAGVEVVANDLFPVDRDGPLEGGSIDWWQDELGNADHRKMLVIDGQVGWAGGAGFEDHFLYGPYHDTYARVTGAVVRQMQMVFLTSFHVLGGQAPEREVLGGYFPAPVDPGTIPATVLHNVPGGHLPGTQAIREVIDTASRELDILNPYLADPDIIDRIEVAGERGVDVTLVGPGESNVPQARAALHHNYPRLFAAGVEGYEFEELIHAKVIVADDTVVIGSINLDAWALYRNHEIAIMLVDPTVAGDARSTMIEDVLARSYPVDVDEGRWSRVQNWFWDKFVYFL